MLCFMHNIILYSLYLLTFYHKCYKLNIYIAVFTQS